MIEFETRSDRQKEMIAAADKMLKDREVKRKDKSTPKESSDEPANPMAIFMNSDLANYADLIMAATEKRDLMPACDRPWGLDLPPPLPDVIVPWPRDVARRDFRARLADLVDRLAAATTIELQGEPVE